MNEYTLPFSKINMNSLPRVGGKNASLGEMFCNLSGKGIAIPNGFATTTEAWWTFLEENGLREKLEALLDTLDTKSFTNLGSVGREARNLISHGHLPKNIQKAILAAYKTLHIGRNDPMAVAVRSSATAEDLPTASFAGQLESFLNIKGNEALIDACKRCFASLYTDRAIKYRADQGFGQTEVAVSVGVQQMVNASSACSGVAFTIDPDSGFDKAVVISGSWGLGENVVKGTVDPDEFIVFKPSLEKGLHSILSKKIGKKQQTMIYAENTSKVAMGTTINRETTEIRANQFVLTNLEIEQIAEWAIIIEEHYRKPMDIEWAKDGDTQEIFIVQARPETVHATVKEKNIFRRYILEGKGKLLAQGISLGNKIAAGKARIIRSPKEGHLLQEGEILITELTNPDWDPIMKKASAIVTDKGGRTSHAAIVARELGVVAVVGTGNSTKEIGKGQEITVSCAEGKTGKIYEGILSWKEESIDISDLMIPETEPKLILGDPTKAFFLAGLPHKGIGLMRLEFVISNSIQIHPLALVHYDSLKDAEAKQAIAELTHSYPNKRSYFTEKLSQAVATIAAAFWPEEVIVRMSDFKSNEYANLIGGREFEPEEENPMIGFRGASRYYSESYEKGFQLECEAMKFVRDRMGLTNVKLMIPFCRTIKEGKKVLATMKKYGLERGQNGLEVYVMIEIPSNVILAEQFAEIFDGFSIGSNDLTQFTLGIDRDSALVSDLFDEKNQAVKNMIASVIKKAKESGTKIGLCGQAPSDFPEFANFLVKQGIDSISFTPDSLIKGIENINLAEREKLQKV